VKLRFLMKLIKFRWLTMILKIWVINSYLIYMMTRLLLKQRRRPPLLLLILLLLLLLLFL